jgi:hypothetical protein
MKKEQLEDTRYIRICYFTGLPSHEILMAIYDFISPIPVPHYQLLSLNPDNQLLSCLFHVHASTVSRYFQK